MTTLIPKYDQGATGAVNRPFNQKLAESVSVKDFGAVGDGVTDDTSAIQLALNSAYKVQLPAGTYKVSTTLTIPDSTLFIGDGIKSELAASTITGPVIQLGPDNVSTVSCGIENIAITGTATKAFSANYSLNCFAKNIWAVGTFTDGFYFRFCYPGNFENLYTNGSTISNACFAFGDEVNACVFTNLYTSNFCTYNFYWNSTGHGNTFNDPCAQGGQYGFYVAQMYGFGTIVINGLYTENVPTPVSLTGAQSITFNNAYLAGPELTHPQYSTSVSGLNIVSANGCRFNGVHFIGTSQSAGGYPTVTIGGAGSGAFAIARVSPTGTISSVQVLNPGSGYTTGTAVITGGGGAGAVLTPVIVGNQIVSITVTTAGSGYKRPQYPVAVTYTDMFNCSFNNCTAYTDTPGVNIPFYPLLVRNAGANFASTFTVEDVSLWYATYGVSAKLQSTNNGGGFAFAVSEFSNSGSLTTHIYTPPVFP